MHKPESILENEMHKILWDFEIQTDHLISNIQTDHLISTRRRDLVLVNKKQRICHLADFAILVNHRVKIKENDKIYKYLDLARVLVKRWNMMMTVIPIIVGALATVSKCKEKRLYEVEIRRWSESIQIIAMLRSTRIPRRVLETWGNLLSLRLQWKTSS